MLYAFMSVCPSVRPPAHTEVRKPVHNLRVDGAKNYRKPVYQSPNSEEGNVSVVRLFPLYLLNHLYGSRPQLAWE